MTEEKAHDGLSKSEVADSEVRSVLDRALPSEKQEWLYSAVADHNIYADGQVWQVPALSITAQAFVFQTVLAPGSSDWARLAASALSMLITIVCVSLMIRHREGQHVTDLWLEAYEKKHMKGVSFHHSNQRSARDKTRLKGVAGWADLKFWRKQYQTADGVEESVRHIKYNVTNLWIWSLLCFPFISLAITAANWLNPSILSQPSGC